MTFDEIFKYTFKSIRKELGLPRKSQPAVEASRADDSEWCLDVVKRGWLTESQMHHAAERYRLGKSRSGKTIFWMLKEKDNWLDGHIGDDWVIDILRRRYPEVADYIKSYRCLFGQHLIDGCYKKLPVGLVESESSALVLSELYPECIWMAWVYTANCTYDLFKPLKGHRVTVYPPTDSYLGNYMAWSDRADILKSEYHLDITVSSFLEDHATPAQKEREIDLVDFLFE
jgi:hypothetical protein